MKDAPRLSTDLQDYRTIFDRIPKKDHSSVLTRAVINLILRTSISNSTSKGHIQKRGHIHAIGKDAQRYF